MMHTLFIVHYILNAEGVSRVCMCRSSRRLTCAVDAWAWHMTTAAVVCTNLQPIILHTHMCKLWKTLEQYVNAFACAEAAGS